MAPRDTVLVIDDDQAIVDALCMFLEIEGFTAEGYSGSDILEKVKSLHPDLLLLDVWLNGLDGLDICRKIKSDRDLESLPLILISASRDLASKAALAGADDYLEKPFDMDAVLATVHALLEKRKKTA